MSYPQLPSSNLTTMTTHQDHNMISDDDDAPLMLIRYQSARDQSIPLTVRSEPTMTLTMASSSQLPLTSDLALTVASAPASTPREKIPQTPEQTLKKQLAEAKKDTQWEHDDKLRIKKARTIERKEIVTLKAEKRELYARLHVKDTELKEKDTRIAQEQNQRAGLSREHDELARQLEAAKKSLGSGEMALVEQINGKDRELRKLKTERATEKAELYKRVRQIENLKAPLAREVEVYTGEIEKLKAQRAKEKAELNEKSQEIERLKAELAERQSNAAGNPQLQNLMLELQKTQASLMTPATSPKTADRGMEIGTQTDDDGLAERVAAIKRMLG